MTLRYGIALAVLSRCRKRLVVTQNPAESSCDNRLRQRVRLHAESGWLAGKETRTPQTPSNVPVVIQGARMHQPLVTIATLASFTGNRFKYSGLSSTKYYELNRYETLETTEESK